MKKTTLLVFAFAMLGAVSSVKAQSGAVPSTQLPQGAQVQEQIIGKQQIKTEELPEGVKQALENDVLKEWQVSKIYKVAPDTASEVNAAPLYEVYFTNQAQHKTIARFDETGKALMAAEGK